MTLRWVLPLAWLEASTIVCTDPESQRAGSQVPTRTARTAAWVFFRALSSSGPYDNSTGDTQYVTSDIQIGLQESGLFLGGADRVRCSLILTLEGSCSQILSCLLRKYEPWDFGGHRFSFVTKDRLKPFFWLIYFVWKKGQDAGFIPNTKSHTELLQKYVLQSVSSPDRVMDIFNYSPESE